MLKEETVSRSYVPFLVGVLSLGCTLVSLYADEHCPDSDPDKPNERQIAIAYGVADLPVWRLDEGQPNSAKLGSEMPISMVHSQAVI